MVKDKMIAAFIAAGADANEAETITKNIMSSKNKNDAMHCLNGTGLSAAKHKISKLCNELFSKKRTKKVSKIVHHAA